MLLSLKAEANQFLTSGPFCVVVVVVVVVVVIVVVVVDDDDDFKICFPFPFEHTWFLSIAF